jgi:hypothetical protein
MMPGHRCTGVEDENVAELAGIMLEKVNSGLLAPEFAAFVGVLHDMERTAFGVKGRTGAVD